MRLTTLISLTTISLTLISLCPNLTSAECCHARIGGDCGDNSSGTLSCCGYGKCDAFCCHCQPVWKGRQLVEILSGTYVHPPYETEITAECGKSYVCRLDLITAHPPKSQCSYDLSHVSTHQADKKRDLFIASANPTITQSPMTKLSHIAVRKLAVDDLADAAELYDTFMKASGGAEHITIDQYLEFFGYNATVSDCERKAHVMAKFHLQDKNGDGLLTIDEAGRRCEPGMGCDD